MDKFDESHIIKQLQDDNTRVAAFTSIVESHKEQLYWQIRRMVINHDDTDDILQNTFTKAWIGLNNFRGESKISTWLYRIACNETYNFIERNKHTLDHIDNDASDVALTLESDPYFDGDETQIQLQRAIQQLPTKQRQVFNLKYFEEMQYEEMSQLMGTSIGALKASYHHAVRKITDFFTNLD